MSTKTTHTSPPRSLQTLLSVHRCIQVFWAVTLGQNTSESKSLDDLTPTTFTSVKLSDTQCNYAALVIEAFAIYMLVKRPPL